MKVAVIGAGVVGVATAWELASDGHEVTVFDRRGTVAEEASFASGALVSPAWSGIWSGPAQRLQMPWSASGPGIGLSHMPRFNELGWLWRWIRAARDADHPTRQQAVLRLAQYSAERHASLSAELDLDHDRSDGMLVLWRSAQEQALAQPAVATLRALNLGARELQAEEARAMEPALNPETPLHGALWLYGMGAANCREWALLMRGRAQDLGVRFELGTPVQGISVRPGAGIELRTGSLSEPSPVFDAVVVCAGASSAGLLRPLGLKLPLQPVWSHSVSAALREPLDAPVSAVFDARHRVSIARLGQRIRIAGGSELGGSGTRNNPAVLKKLYQVLMDWFPGAARLGGTRGSVQEWRGAQAMLPDGPPVIGPSRVPGVWLNLGHGGAGWSLCAGTARLLADQMAGRPPAVDPGAFSAARIGLG